ncbi:MAG: hypothetical protein WAU45_12570 [Blastocatellia bacterium]
MAATEVEAVAAFLRVINALENIRSTIEVEQRAKTAVSFEQARELLKLSFADLENAIEVLGCGDLNPDAVMKLKEALAIDLLALITSHRPTRNSLIDPLQFSSSQQHCRS